MGSSTLLRIVAASSLLLLIHLPRATAEASPSSSLPSSSFVAVAPRRRNPSAASSAAFGWTTTTTTATRGRGVGAARGWGGGGSCRRGGRLDDEADPIRVGGGASIATTSHVPCRRVRMTATNDDRTNEERSGLSRPNDDDSAEKEPEKLADSPDFYVRESRYKDLKSVADIVVTSFYKSTDSPLRHLYYVSELNRLQQNFPYSDPLHSMYVAVDRLDESMVGFVDVDGRPSKLRTAPPRPYLSDLAVRSDKRRSGIATTLVRTCEAWAFDAAGGGKFDALYIRVERTNEAAVRMYENLGYEARKHEIFGVEDRTTLLRRDLNEVDSSLSCAEGGGDAGEERRGDRDSVPILDYSL